MPDLWPRATSGPRSAGRASPAAPASFVSFGELLKFLRRRARLTQRQLGMAVGYTEGHISRLEQNHRTPDVATLAALFVPALGLDDDPLLADRLLELAAGAHGEPVAVGLEPIPPPPSDAVARPRVLADLRDRLARERRIAICGLAGMGKTTLAATLAREHDLVGPVCWVTLTEGVTAPAEALVRHLARFMRSQGHAEADRLLKRSEGFEPLTLDEQLGYLGAALVRAPALLCLDNAHLLRDDALAMLEHLIATTPVRLLLTTREAMALPGVSVLRLGGLEHDEARELIARTGQDLSPELAERLVTRTAGSPMLLRLALGQLHSGRNDPAMLVERLESEPQVTSYLLSAILRGLSPAAARLLSLLAVFRRPVDLHDERLVDLIQEAEGPYDLTAALGELPRCQLVDHPAVAALHPLVRDHLYANLVGDLTRRRRLHRLAAAWTREVAGDLLEAAYHLGQAGEVTEAADLLRAQTDTLVVRGQALTAADLARDLLARARQLPGDHGALVRNLLVVRGDLLVNTVRAAEAEADYREAHAAATPPLRSQISWRLAQSLIQRGHAAEAARLCEQASAALGPGDLLLQAQLATTRCQAHQQLSQLDEAVAAARLALDLAARLGGAPLAAVAELEARAHATLGDVLRLRGQWPEAIQHLHHAVDAARRAERPEVADRAMFALGAAYGEQGDLDKALVIFTEVLAALRAVGDSYFAARTLQAISQVRLSQGELATALAAIDEARELRAQLGDAEGVTTCWSLRAEVLLALGRVAEARELIQRVVTERTTTVSPLDQAYNLATLAAVHMVAGEPEPAASALRTALAIPDVAGTTYRLQLEIYLALALLVTGDTAPAERLLERPADGEPADGDAPPTAELDRYLLHVALAFARDDRATAVHYASTMARYAEAAGRTRDQAIAVRLIEAADTSTPLTELIALAWGA